MATIAADLRVAITARYSPKVKVHEIVQIRLRVIANLFAHAVLLRVCSAELHRSRLGQMHHAP